MRSLWEESWWRSIHPDQRDLWRGVEAQHVAATMRLVDDLEEQALLEQILEDSKPPAPAVPKHQHYLLWTPFRYRSPVASRFRRGGDWVALGAYQALASSSYSRPGTSSRTACAEIAWRSSASSIPREGCPRLGRRLRAVA